MACGVWIGWHDKTPTRTEARRSRADQVSRAFIPPWNTTEVTPASLGPAHPVREGSGTLDAPRLCERVVTSQSRPCVGRSAAMFPLGKSRWTTHRCEDGGMPDRRLSLPPCRVGRRRPPDRRPVRAAGGHRAPRAGRVRAGPRPGVHRAGDGAVRGERVGLLRRHPAQPFGARPARARRTASTPCSSATATRRAPQVVGHGARTAVRRGRPGRTDRRGSRRRAPGW